jgi:outer membrane receptor protein involved in Fe transport
MRDPQIRSRLAVILIVLVVLSGVLARQSCAQNDPSSGELQTIIVTAQKREQNINDVGMSITAVSGDQLVERGAQDPAELAKVVPGFQYDSNAFGNPIYSMRGVGFQDSTLSASPTVTVYQDEVPIPFSAETIGAGLDVERLEALKGPQGTLYGENATGGALNFVAAKPTRTFQSGLDASYGRFSTADVSAFASGPLSDTLAVRVSTRIVEGGDWQQSYTPTNPSTLGQQNLIEGRVLMDWRPTDKLKISLNLNGWQDQSDTEEPQLIGVVGLGTNATLYPPLTVYPNAPANDRAAGWDSGENYARNNTFYMASFRMDYDFRDDTTLTLISSYQDYRRYQPIDGDGTPYQDLFLTSYGSIKTNYDEARLAGALGDHGHWIVGMNYEDDQTFDEFVEKFSQSTSREIFGLPLSGTSNFTDQAIRTYAGYGSVDYALTDTLSIQGGARYTQSNRDFSGCSQDDNGQAAAIFDLLQQLLKGSYVAIPVGGCINLDASYNPALATGKLDEDNVSWRGGINWKAVPGTLLYANVSKGFKAGSFPTLSASATSQFKPVTQESLIAYELGSKSTLLNDSLQINSALFYYDYKNKQILGRILDPIFGPLLTLVNVPKSRIQGVEFQSDWKPFRGFTLAADLTYLESKIEGDYVNYDSFGDLKNFTGNEFPYTPKAQGSLDAEYSWHLAGNYDAFADADYSYQSRSNGSLGNYAILEIRSRSLVDLRAGVKNGNWRFSLWGRNVTNEYYWNTVLRDNDTINRFAGMPATFGVEADYRMR